jgi:hypothetical protein
MPRCLTRRQRRVARAAFLGVPLACRQCEAGTRYVSCFKHDNVDLKLATHNLPLARCQGHPRSVIPREIARRERFLASGAGEAPVPRAQGAEARADRFAAGTRLSGPLRVVKACPLSSPDQRDGRRGQIAERFGLGWAPVDGRRFARPRGGTLRDQGLAPLAIEGAPRWGWGGCWVAEWDRLGARGLDPRHTAVWPSCFVLAGSSDLGWHAQVLAGRG